MTQREEFEAWFHKYDDNNFMTAEDRELMFEAWQAAKSALLTLPDRMDYELHGDSVIDSHHNTFADGYNECLSDVIAMNEEYANSTGSDGWIPVSERLPEHKNGLWSDPVIAMTDTGNIYRLSYCGGWQRTSEFMASGSNKVTHWMPLPAAPEQNK